MPESILVDKNKPAQEVYTTLMPQLDSLILSGEPVISGLSNFTGALKEAFDKISWAGFYIKSGDKLYLGPFQGKPACTVIEIGKGVCGKAAEEKRTIIVEDVDRFPGHIACDAGSRSEIVVPIIIQNEIWGVLDLDSHHYSAFNETDKFHLENFMEFLKKKLILNNFQVV